MHVYLINLDEEKARLNAADAQLRRLGVSYTRVSAVNAKEMPPDELLCHVNRFRWWCAVGRPVRPGEVGCALSHYGVYANLTEVACVLEDDVVLDDRFKEVMEAAGAFANPRRPQVVLLSNHVRHRPKCEFDMPKVVRTSNDMYSEGYVITPMAAQVLCRSNSPLQTPCDHWGRWARRGLIELYHAFPTVCSQDQSQYVSSIGGVTDFRVSDLAFPIWLLHKCKRAVGRSIDRIMPL